MLENKATTGTHLKNEYIAFSLAFIGSFGIILLCLALMGRGFIWQFDGLQQQYPFFMAEGTWLRQLLHGRLVLWDQSMGYGYDSLIFLGNTLGNPFNLISVFATPTTGTFLLNLTVPCMLYTAGMSFVYCAKRLFSSREGIWLAALVYVYSGYTAIIFFQTAFVYVLVLAPLMLVGIERVFEGRYLTYPLVVCAFALYYVMQTYIALLFAVVYCVVRLAVTKQLKLRTFAKYVAVFSGLTFLGLGMAALLLLPLVHLLVHMDRLTLVRTHPWHYTRSLYQGIFLNFALGTMVGPDAYWGTGAAGFFSWFYLAFKRRKTPRQRILLTMLVICTITVFVPFLGRLTNALSYASNRWVWVLSLVSALAFLDFYQHRADKTFAFKLSLSAVFGLSALAIAAHILISPDSMGAPDLAAFIGVLVVALALYYFAERPVVQQGGIFAGISICALALCVQASSYGTLPLTQNTYTTSVTQNPASLALALDTSADEGVDFGTSERVYNSFALIGTRDGTFYNSYYNSAVDKLHALVGLSTSPVNHLTAGLAPSQTLEELAGTKYFIEPATLPSTRPLLFDDPQQAQVQGRPYVVYRNPVVLPTAFVPQESLSEQAFYGLSMVERQQALAKYLVVDGAPNNTAVGLGVGEIPAALSAGPGTTLEAPKAGPTQIAAADLGTNAAGTTIPATCQIYLPATKAEVLYVEITGLHHYNAKGQESYSADIAVSAGTSTATYWLCGPQNHMYGGKHNVVLALRPEAVPVTELTLQLKTPGTYRFDSLRVRTIDPTTADKNLRSLISPAVTEQSWGTNSFSATYASTGHDLAFRIPYSEGWTATVDGAPAKLKRADIAFMALSVPAGTHKVALSYTTPWLKEGAVISLVSWAFYVGFCVYRRRKPAAERAKI